MVLSQHHSADPLYLKKVKRHFALKQEAMEYWRCSLCGWIMKPSYSCCGSCGGKWKEVMDSTYVHQPQPRQRGAQSGDDWPNYTGWSSWEEWTEGPWRPRSQSPRGSRPGEPKSPRQNNKGQKGPKGKDKGKGKGRKGPQQNKGAKGVGKGKPSNGPPAIEPEPPWTMQPATEVATPPPPPTAAETQLQQLIQALRRADSVNLPADVQQLLTTAEKRASQTEVKSLYSAVNRISHAQKQLLNAQRARTTLHQNWNTHLLESVQRWRGYANDFGTLDQDLATQTTAAKDALQQARQTLTENRGSATSTTEEATHVVSDTEEMEAEPDRADTANSIMEGLQTMVTSLEGLQQQTEALLPERNAKRPRREEAEVGETVETPDPPEGGKGTPGKLGQGALQPFAGGR